MDLNTSEKTRKYSLVSYFDRSNVGKGRKYSLVPYLDRCWEYSGTYKVRFKIKYAFHYTEKLYSSKSM